MSDAGSQPEPVAAGSPSAPITVPPQEDFPVEWASPEEQQIPWQLDLMHFNNVMPPLEGEYWAQFMDGLTLAMKHFEMPLQGAAKAFNYWLYFGIFPRFPPEQMEAQGKRGDEVVMATVHRLQERWDDEWLPEIMKQIKDWDAYDLSAASTEDLRAHFSQVREGSHRLADLHFQIITPVYIALSLLDDLYNDLFSDGVFESQKLFQGFDNKTMEVGRALWDLSRKAVASDGVREIFEAYAPGDVMNALAELGDGQAFSKELDVFLNSHGRRVSDWGIRHESWLEDPTPVMVNIRDYIQQERDPDAEHEERAAEREDAIATVRTRLQGYPSNVRDEFERLLNAAAVAVVLTEDHGYWIDFQATYRVRRVIVEIGKRLAEAGTLKTAADVFFLRTDEILAALSSSTAGASTALDHTGLVEARKTEMEHFGSLKPPMLIGTDYGPPPPDLLGTALGKFFGAPAEQNDDADTVSGNAGSPGKFTGTARVVGSLDEADRLGVGEILVAETTSPSWTPLFATAAGIVTDTGGILSHCAVVAREYGIPAVVGTGVATARIRDGQTIEVDGDTGQVRLID
jgi:phosphohistidine swiveling domain-containing protein